ncbi:hypothetical protein NQ318_022890 [Aromia moschata]|uniref:Mos1 transposase HTH domain-containing protein n=1 Tax=Aromia moschata TaxID=1265417 RepID=A0AAV8XWU4_9CUCU|nr:hypothetical protein NQ318_022890 [Aromia moschata]
MLKKAFGVDCFSDRQIFRWHKAFAEGREKMSTTRTRDHVRLNNVDHVEEGRVIAQLLQGLPQSWKISTTNRLTNLPTTDVKHVRDLLNTDRRLSVRLTSETLDITETIVHEIVSESLGMRKELQKWTRTMPLVVEKLSVKYKCF